MARLARVVIPGLTHHVTQHGNRGERVFFQDDDYRAYLQLISAAAQSSGAAIWAYCLMPNPVHLIMVPADPDGLRRSFAEAHRRYTARIHAREHSTGHLWQGRFSSTAMDERHLMAAARYVPMNPVRAGLVAKAQDWPWSSARAHLAGEDDGVVTVAPLLGRIADFAALLDAAEDAAAVMAIRRSRSTDRPAGGGARLDQGPGGAHRAIPRPGQARAETGGQGGRGSGRSISYSVTAIPRSESEDIAILSCTDSFYDGEWLNSERWRA